MTIVLDRPADDVSAVVDRARTGDPAAFGEIYRRCHPRIMKFVLARVGGNRHLAEDLTADTFLRAHGSIGRYQWQGRDIEAWLVTIARNLVADHYKRLRTRMERVEPIGFAPATGEAYVWDLADESTDGRPDHATVRRMAGVAVMAALANLSPDQRECLTLRYLRGLSVAETCAVMGREEGAVKALAHRGIRALGRTVDPSWGGA